MKKINLKKVAKVGWLQRWSGSYTFISCSYWGPQYHSSLKRTLKVGFDHMLFIHKKGTASFYVSNGEFRKLGNYLAYKSIRDLSFAKAYCKSLKENTDVLIPIMEKLEHTIPTLPQYKKFLNIFDKHLAFHVFVKKTVDFLPIDALEKLLPYFKDARVYSEKVYSKSEAFFRNIMQEIAKKENYNADYLTCMTQKELEAYLNKKILPKEESLKQRFLASALYFEKDKCTIILGSEVKILERLMLGEELKNKKEITGIVGYPGRVKGVARVVSDPFKPGVFNKGDILITGMTRPEFLPLIKKAAAIVTESGGILSHAAIVAREFKKPCIVGTQIATKLLKSGDIIEVDAIKGIIKIVK